MLLRYSVLRLRIQPTILTPIPPIRIAPGAGIAVTDNVDVSTSIIQFGTSTTTEAVIFGTIQDGLRANTLVVSSV
jgi:hypothetical protein